MGKSDTGTTCRSIRLIGHALKKFERTVDQRLRKIADITSNQCGFERCRLRIQMHAVRLLAEKRKEGSTWLYMQLSSTSKGFWQSSTRSYLVCSQKYNVLEEHIDWIKMIYEGAESHFRRTCSSSLTKEFSIKGGLHQGSAFSPLLFVTVLDTIVSDVQKPPPWNLLYADDVFLAMPTRQELVNKVCRSEAAIWSKAEYQKGGTHKMSPVDKQFSG